MVIPFSLDVYVISFFFKFIYCQTKSTFRWCILQLGFHEMIPCITYIFFPLFHFFVFIILPVRKIENKHSPKKSRCKTNSAEILFCVIHIRHQSPRVFTFFFCQCLSMVMIIFLSYKVTYIQKKKRTYDFNNFIFDNVTNSIVNIQWHQFRCKFN